MASARGTAVRADSTRADRRTRTPALGLIPINPADNVLHIVLTVAAIAAGLASRDRHARHRNV